MISPLIIVCCVAAYFGLLMLIAHFTGKKNTNEAFFIGNRKSPWPVVAFGMIGASLSGITFISVPGWVGDSQFSYFQMVLGYLPGYAVIAFVLMPLYYRLKLTSIYTYLKTRFGLWSYKTGAAFFLISRTIGASFRLYLVAIVLQMAVFDPLQMHIPFTVTVLITLLLIWLYTHRGGIRTIIWTDTLQTLFMLLAVGLTIWLVARQLNLGAWDMIERIRQSGYSRALFLEDLNDNRHFVKQFISGAFMAIVMTGLDQDMMQKNLSCRSLRDAQKNMISFSLVLLIVNVFFLALGAMLFIFAERSGIQVPEKTDLLYPLIAIGGYLGPVAGVVFILGLIAAAYSSADSALTALTTSFCVDIIDIESKPVQSRIGIRKRVHILISAILLLLILAFKSINDKSVIESLFTVAGYTYGPLLGLYAFGLFTRIRPRDRYVLAVCILAPVAGFIFQKYAPEWFNGYEVGFELLLINGLLTFAGLLCIGKYRGSLVRE